MPALTSCNIVLEFLTSIIRKEEKKKKDIQFKKEKIKLSQVIYIENPK